MSNNQNTRISASISGTTLVDSPRSGSPTGSVSGSPDEARAAHNGRGDGASRRATFHATYPNSHAASPRASVPGTSSPTSSVSSCDNFDALVMGQGGDQKGEKGKNKKFDWTYKNLVVSGGGVGNGVMCDLMWNAWFLEKRGIFDDFFDDFPIGRLDTRRDSDVRGQN